MLTLAITSGNDYSDNIYGHGILKNLQWLQQESGNVDELLKKYCSAVGCDVTAFDLASQIFIHYSETFKDPKKLEDLKWHQLSDKLEELKSKKM